MEKKRRKPGTPLKNSTPRGKKAAARGEIPLSTGAAVPGAIALPERPTYEPPEVPGWPEWVPRFLKALSETGNVRAAGIQGGIAATKHIYALRKADPVFADEWKRALGVAVWEAETTYRYHALNGWKEVVVKKDRDGNVIESQERTRYSPKMHERLLAVNDPERWGNKNTVEVNRTDTISVKGVQEMLRDPRIAALVCELDEAMAAPVTVVEALPAPDDTMSGCAVSRDSANARMHKKGAAR